MKPKTIFGLAVVIFILLFLSASLYTVTQGHRAMLVRLGTIVKNKSGQVKMFGPGLHFKWPLIYSVRDFDVRLQSFSVDSSRILTAEQKYVIVDYYTKWKITDPALYYTRTNDIADTAEMLLKQKINDALRQAFGVREIQEVISGGRSDISTILREKANETAKELGITVVDVRIKGIDLPHEVRESVFARMRAQREQVATHHRAEGKAQAESLKADADAKVEILIAQAQANAEKIRAEGDTKAAEVYSHAYQKDPAFYAFYRSMQAYRKVFDKQGNVMVLKPNGQFFKYFNENGVSGSVKK